MEVKDKMVKLVKEMPCGYALKPESFDPPLSDCPTCGKPAFAVWSGHGSNPPPEGSWDHQCLGWSVHCLTCQPKAQLTTKYHMEAEKAAEDWENKVVRPFMTMTWFGRLPPTFGIDVDSPVTP